MAGTEHLAKKPLISVIVPCYNQAEYLAESLDSVLLQEYSEWECIIINDGSVDNTEKVAVEYEKKDSRFKYLYQANKGLSGARNAGIQIAVGEYILPLDADDIIANQYLELAIKAFQENQQLKLVYCQSRTFGYEAKMWALPKYSYKNILIENCIFCSALFKRNDWVEFNGYDEDLLYGWEDWAFWLKILDENSIVHQIQKTLFFYRIKPSSMLQTMPAYYKEFVRWKVFHRNMPAYKKYFEAPQTLIIAHNVSFEIYKNILNSYSYKLGNFLIKPFSLLKQLYIKKQ